MGVLPSIPLAGRARDIDKFPLHSTASIQNSENPTFNVSAHAGYVREFTSTL